MKKLLIAILLLASISFASGQITLEHIYPNGTNNYNGQSIRVVHFSSLGYKYAITHITGPSGGTITLYNLNHSLYKIISIPNQPSGTYIYVYYISDSLFNTNTSSIKYLINYSDSVQIGHVRVYDDIGNTLFSRDSVTLSSGGSSLPCPYTEPIFYTPNGYKMILSAYYGSIYDTAAYIYSLPGALPCDECSNGVLTGLAGPMNGNNSTSGYLSSPYPNPSSHATTIKYQLPEGENSGQLIFYDLSGREIKTFSVDRTFDSVDLTTFDLAAGTYLYILRTTNGNVGSKKMVVIR